MCGIAGIISDEKTPFNINHFNILGTLNDERGGDSCGIFIDGDVKYGINNDSYFRIFTKNVSYKNQASIALVHCRKASVGYNINIEQAQPIIIKEDNKIKFVLLHNGTITNIKELAIKYLGKDFNITNLSDSQILAKIIYNKGFDVLNEYRGTAALVIVDYRSKIPEVFIFKGNSCYNEKSTNYERPLYYMVDNNKFYFSSIYSSLYCINYNAKIIDFPTNVLCKVINNKINIIKKIDRTSLKELSRLPFYNIGYYNSDYYDDYDDNYGYNNYKNEDRITCLNNGLYTWGDHLVTGNYLIYATGYRCLSKISNIHAYNLYFYKGRLLPNKECYDFLIGIDELFDEDALISYCPEIIDYFAYNPRCFDNKTMCVDSTFHYVPYNNGEYAQLFFYSKLIRFKNGKKQETQLTPKDAITTFIKYTKHVYYNFDELEKEIYKIISNKIVC